MSPNFKVTNFFIILSASELVAFNRHQQIAGGYSIFGMTRTR